MVDAIVNKVWLYTMNYKHAHAPFLDLRNAMVKFDLMENRTRQIEGW